MRVLLSLILLCLAAASQAADTPSLIDIVETAGQADPQWAAAQRTLAADKELRKQGRAALLPRLDLNFNRTRVFRDTEIPARPTATPPTPAFTDETRFTRESLSATVVQPLFVPEAWFGKNQGKALTSAGIARFESARQDFLLRATRRYLDVLRRWEDRQTARAEERALARQLEQTEERFEVGLVPVTDVEEAKAGHDLSRVGLITAEADFDVSVDQLEALTGQRWRQLAGLRNEVPMTGPEPADPSLWMQQAREQSPEIMAARFDADAAKAAAKQRTSAQLPTVNLVGTYEDTTFPSSPGNTEIEQTQFLPFDNRAIGIDVNLPLFAGGSLNSQRREAHQRYQAAEENYQLVWRDVGQNAQSLTRQVQAAALNVRARRQALRSAQSALQATESGYDVGTRNVVDVLDAQRNMFANQRDYSAARYDYILLSLQLQAAAGDLETDDIEVIDGWLDPASPVSLTSAP